jgi:GLPGLI family protein
MRILILLFVVIYFPIHASAQFNYPIKVIEPTKYIVTYSLKYQPDSLNSSFIDEKEMLLFVGNNGSKFISKNFFTRDTIVRKIKSWAEFDAIMASPGRQVPRSAFLYQIFKNYHKGDLTCIDYTADGGFIYTETLNGFNWQLAGETATHNGYKVQKAMTSFGGREWVAWFAPELPFNDGPYKFNGLPGLIVKLYDSRNHYVFEFISINKPHKELMIDYVVKDFVKATKQDFFRAEDAFRADIINRAKIAGLNNELQQRAARNLARKNNPIELKRK